LNKLHVAGQLHTAAPDHFKKERVAAKRQRGFQQEKIIMSSDSDVKLRIECSF
jgi:hypothetical protein